MEGYDKYEVASCYFKCFDSDFFIDESLKGIRYTNICYAHKVKKLAGYFLVLALWRKE